MSNLQLPIREFNIGIKTREIITGEKDCASDRIRAKMIADCSEDIELYRYDTNYFTIIFHQIDFEGLERHREQSILNGLAIYDICDYTWLENADVLRFAQEVDVVTVASQSLKDKIIEDGLKTTVYVIGDGHDLTNRRKKWHKDKAEWVVWFGYIENFVLLDEYLDVLKENGLKLRIIAQRDNKKGDEFIKWDVNTYYDDINNCDFALLPTNGVYKTNNKTVTAWLCGLPVAKTKEDMVNFIEKKARLEYLRDVDYYKFNIIKRAEEYRNLCVKYWGLKNDTNLDWKQRIKNSG